VYIVIAYKIKFILCFQSSGVLMLRDSNVSAFLSLIWIFCFGLAWVVHRIASESQIMIKNINKHKVIGERWVRRHGV